MIKSKIGKADVVRLRMIIRKAGANETDLLEFLKGIWYEGYCDRIAEERNSGKTAEEDFIKFKRGQDYVITCPHCSKDILVDFKEMRADSAVEAVEEVMDKTNWEVKHKFRR